MGTDVEATVVRRTSAVVFAERDGELLAVHGPEVEAFPFSLVADAATLARLPDAGPARISGRPVAPARTVAARCAPAGMRDALTGVPGLAARTEALSAWTGPLAAALGTGGDALPAAEALLGRGPGLTPAGDDVLVGLVAMAAHGGRAWDLEDVAELARALAGRAPGRTTTVAAALLRHAARGRFAPAVGAVCRTDGARLGSALTRLAAVGATSGLDTLVGVAVACDAARARANMAAPGGRAPN